MRRRTHDEGVAELRLARIRIGKIAERAVERLDAVGGTGIDPFSPWL